MEISKETLATLTFQLCRPADTYSKWLGIYATYIYATTAQATIQYLYKIFGVHGLPELLFTEKLLQVC